MKHNGRSLDHCDNARIEALIGAYRATNSTETLSQIVQLAEERARTLIRFYKTNHYRSEDELISDINFKLLRSVSRFDPKRGSAFTFVSHVITNVLCTSVTNARKHAGRFECTSESDICELVAKSEDYTFVDDITHKIRSTVRSTLVDETELSAQRWYIDSFCEDGFESRRHACADAAMAVYKLTHARSRELYDLTMLEVRLVLYSDVSRRPRIIPGRLHGTRCAWMARYAPLMTRNEFTKFVVLMRDLAPYLLFIIDATFKSRRRDRNPAISRRNIELVLNGCPDAILLFNQSISNDNESFISDSSSL